MRINFEFELGFWDFIESIKQSVRELVCRYKGHDWEKYKKLKGLWANMELYDSYFLGVGEREFQCKRCGKCKYKKAKPKTVRWVRYSDLKSDNTKSV